MIVLDNVIQSEIGAIAITNAIHRADPLSVVTNTCSKFIAILKTVRGDDESPQNFKSRFDAALTDKMPPHALPTFLSHFLLLFLSEILSSLTFKEFQFFLLLPKAIKYR